MGHSSFLIQVEEAQVSWLQKALLVEAVEYSVLSFSALYLRPSHHRRQ